MTGQQGAGASMSESLQCIIYNVQFLPKFLRHEKKQESVICTRASKQVMETTSEEAPMLDLAGRFHNSSKNKREPCLKNGRRGKDNVAPNTEHQERGRKCYKNVNRTSGVEKYKNWSSKFTEGSAVIWADRSESPWTWIQMGSNSVIWRVERKKNK